MKTQVGKWLIMSALCVLVACQKDPTSASTCKYGEASPILSDTMQAVSTYRFEHEQQQSIEYITLTDGQVIEVFQEGCQVLQQSYRFQMDTVPSGGDSSDWVYLAAQYMGELANISPALHSLALWAQEIAARADEWNLDEINHIEANYYCKIEHIQRANQSWIIITLIGK